MKGYRLLGVLVAALLCTPAQAAKVEVETGARLLPTTACLVETGRLRQLGRRPGDELLEGGIS